MSPGEIHGLHARVVADLKEQLEQQRTRAEAAELELRELRKLVDEWKATRDAIADVLGGSEPIVGGLDALCNASMEAEERLRHA